MSGDDSVKIRGQESPSMEIPLSDPNLVKFSKSTFKCECCLKPIKVFDFSLKVNFGHKEFFKWNWR